MNSLVVFLAKNLRLLDSPLWGARIHGRCLCKYPTFAARRRPSSFRRLGCLKPTTLANCIPLRPRHRWKLGWHAVFLLWFLYWGWGDIERVYLTVVEWCHFSFCRNWSNVHYLFRGLSSYRFWGGGAGRNGGTNREGSLNIADSRILLHGRFWRGCDVEGL